MNCTATLKRKRFFFLHTMTCIGILLSSCSGDVNQTSDNTVEDFNVKVSENFSHNPLKNLRNIQVGDTLKYDVDLISTVYNGQATYIFNPNSGDGPGHKRLGKDYKAFIYSKDSLQKFHEENDSNKTTEVEWIRSKEVKDSALLSQKGKYVLLIVPLRPGSFTESFTFTEHNSKGNIKTRKQDLNFNCVKLTAWVQAVQTQHGTMVRKSKYRNDFYIRVEDGLEENDRYLSNKKNREQNCMIIYDGRTYNEKFEEGEDICFYRSGERNRHRPPIDTRFIKQIIITQKNVNAPEVIIEFNNVPLNIN